MSITSPHFQARLNRWVLMMVLFFASNFWCCVHVLHQSRMLGHDGAVAAQFVELVDQFDVGAFAGGAGQARRELGNRRQALETFGVVALVHDVNDFIHETIQADKRGQFAGAGDGG